LRKNKPKSSTATLAAPSFPPKLTRDVRSASASGLQIVNPNHFVMIWGVTRFWQIVLEGGGTLCYHSFN
jgi:hypothetical protein